MTNHACPECGSEATLATHTAASSIPFGQAEWEQSVLRCSGCGHEEPLPTDDGILEAAVDKARQESVLVMLAKLKEAGVSMAMLERAFGLAPRTTHHWKQGKFSGAALALLRTAATYPWIAELARHDFDPEVADSALLRATEKLLRDHGLTIEVRQEAPVVPCRDNVVQLRPSASLRPVDDPNHPTVRIG